MRLISWNIRAGGGRRIAGIRNQLLAWRADVITLSEFRGTPPSQQLAQWLHEAGFVHQAQAINEEKRPVNGMLLAAKRPFRAQTRSPYLDQTTRWLFASLEATPAIGIGTMHIPNRVTGKKGDFHAAVLSVAKGWAGGAALLVGDTNTGLPKIDEETAVFTKDEAAWMTALDEAGWKDAFRHLHGSKRAYTWYSPNGKNGFRLDQAFVNPALLPHVKAMRYVWGKSADESARRDALSDHAAIILDLDW